VKLDRRQTSVPRKASALAAAGENVAVPGRDRLFKGVADGLGPLSRGIVSAGIEKSDEQLIVETNNDIKKLISELEKRNENQT